MDSRKNEMRASDSMSHTNDNKRNDKRDNKNDDSSHKHNNKITTTLKRGVDKVIDILSSIFMPIVSLLVACGILKAVLMVLTTTGVMTETSFNYIVLNAIGSSVFYFLPFFVAVTAGKKFGADQFTSMMLAAAIIMPEILSAMDSSESLKLFFIPVKHVTYTSSVLPMILGVFVLSKLERLLKKIIPEMVKDFFVPLLGVGISALLTLYICGQIGSIVSDGIAYGIKSFIAVSPVAVGGVLGAFWQVMVTFGLQWSVIPVAINNIAVNGYDTIFALVAASPFGQAGACLAVAIKAKNKKFKVTAFTAALSGILGITEPAIFAVNLPRKKPMFIGCIAAGIGGIFIGIGGATMKAFALPGLITLPVYLGKGFVWLILGCAVSFTLSTIGTLLFYRDVSTETIDNDINGDIVK
ncbi:MAG: PTS transporter subunit EIIC [Clostridiales Family XIII bacterium]|jgi:PTS system beta-glucosides-specific IIC component|nr:PTS transporter subunit EIIC [Clostridiales Family XIII bacterium]